MSRLHWAALAMQGGIGGKTVTGLLKHFGSLEEALAASHDQLIRIPGIGPRTAEAICSIELGRAEEQITLLKECGVQVVTWEDTQYPGALLRSDDAPPVLFVRGITSPQDDQSIAVVGTRQPSAAGHQAAWRLAEAMAGRGWTIVSGLAIGIDTAAHEGALAAGGRTLCVLGSGVLNVYPRRNVSLADRISAAGAVLAEVPPHAQVSAQSLVARNRITSGLSRAVFVIESAQDSGSMTTARRALAQGRRVYMIADNSTGVQDVLARGAVLLPPAQIDFDALHHQLSTLSTRPPHAEQPSLF